MQTVLAISEKLTPRTPRTPRIPDTPRATCRTLATRGYKLLDRLEGGNYGVIHTGIHIPSREPLIIKELDATGQFQDLASREADMMQVAHHRHVVKLYDRIELDSRLFLVMQYARGGDLHDHIIKSPEGYLSVLEAKRIFAQMVMALSNMHKQHAIHVDIKPDNIFLDENHNVLLGDFGLSDQFKPKVRETVARGGTLHYSAPETFLGQMIEGPELDIWSAGAVLYVMMRGRYPFWGESDSEIAHAIMFLEPFWPEWFPEDAIDLLRKIFTKNPRKRISMSKLKRHPFIHQEIRALKRELSKKSTTRKANRKSSASS